MEYLFKKTELQDLINNAAESDVISIGINFTATEERGKFLAEVTATAVPASGIRSASTSMVRGCPSPPGCT